MKYYFKMNFKVVKYETKIFDHWNSLVKIKKKDLVFWNKIQRKKYLRNTWNTKKVFEHKTIYECYK